MSCYFHFTLGPVQGFVAQARRTRDFWAGSFILSWLSSVAMKETLQQEGSKILFPIEDKIFLAWVQGEEVASAPIQGSVPNRFKASVKSDFDAARIVRAVQIAWRELAEVIWKSDLEENTALFPEARKIWEQQINGFWEINWAMSDDISDTNLLDRRKNWRNHMPPEQAGVKCMMMEGWQELSGATRPHREGKKILDAFWSGLRNSRLTRIKTDLREGEQLCAMAYIKRRFATYFPEVKVSMPGGWTLKGWKVPCAIPSVSYVAAAPWLAELIQKVSDKGLSNQLESFHQLAKKVTQGYDEWDNTIECVRSALKKTGIQKKWAALDGSIFFDHALDNYKSWDATEKDLRNLAGQLKKLRSVVEMEAVSPFYALLMMDGDSLGSQLSEPDKQKPISMALKEFTDKVSEIVVQHDGFLIFAGGDDVLALLPLESAFACSLALRTHYMGCFFRNHVVSTLSGAIEFVHVRMPLTRALKDAHDLLDNVAKDGSGRDSIAVRIWKPGGLQQQWSMPWEHAIQFSDEDGDYVILDRMANEFRRDDESNFFASGFFYRIRERFELLNSRPVQSSDGAVTEESFLDFQQACDLMASEYIASGVNLQRENKINLKSASQYIKPLLEQCQTVIRQVDSITGEVSYIKGENLNADAALLLRFIALKGVEQ